MSKADNKELEEAIKSMQKLKIEIDNIFYALHTSNPKKGKERTAIGTVLKELKRLQEDYIKRQNKRKDRKLKRKRRKYVFKNKRTWKYNRYEFRRV